MEKIIKKRSLKRYLPKRRFQWRYIKLLSGVIILLTVVIMVTLYSTFYLILGTSQLGTYAEGKFNHVFQSLNFFITLEMIIFAIIGVCLSLWISEKIAGPLWRLEKIIREEINGVTFEVKIRQDDELHELAEALNQLITRITTKK